MVPIMLPGILTVSRALALHLPAPHLVLPTSTERQREGYRAGQNSMLDEIPLLSPRRQAVDWSAFRIQHRLTSGVPFSLEDRWAFVGMTRTGKTTAVGQLAKRYVRAYDGLRVHIFDPKDVGDFETIGRGLGVPVHHVRSEVAPDPLRMPGILIWHPKNAGWDQYEKFFRQLADDPEPHLTIVDETRRLIKRLGDGTSMVPSLATLLQEGGGLLHGLIVLLQEVAGTARQILGQSTHVVRFRLENEYDERATERRFTRARRNGRIARDQQEPAHWHGFFHSRVDMLDQAREFSSWQTFI